MAAQIAVQTVGSLFQQEATTQLKSPQRFLESAILDAHKQILHYRTANHLSESPRTTVVACIVQNGSAYWAHAGDSRLYVLRRGELVAQTQDHSRVQMMIESGEITPEMAARHPERNKIFSCLGGVVPPQIASGREFPLETGDTILLSTDGFWAQIPGTILGNMLRKQGLTDLLPGLLTEAQRRARGESDNLSVVAMTWESQEDAGIADTQGMDTEFTSSTNTTESLDSKEVVDDVTDEDIERAINEIQDAIRKVPR
jgi:serine/threonine protein phosphatase PrpC